VPFSENLENGRFKSPEALRELYDSHLSGVDAEHVVVHCGSGVTACHTLLALEIAGMRGASLFVGSWSEWCRNPRPQA
jgi:thiosulfate/3-mercaptopyruvate sulfurtransferase